MRYWRSAKLWLATAAALLMAGLAVAEALAGEPGLKLPPSTVQPAPTPAPARPSAGPEEDVPQFFLFPAAAIERVTEVIEAQQREIKRLRAVVDKGSCS